MKIMGKIKEWDTAAESGNISNLGLAIHTLVGFVLMCITASVFAWLVISIAALTMPL